MKNNICKNCKHENKSSCPPACRDNMFCFFSRCEDSDKIQSLLAEKEKLIEALKISLDILSYYDKHYKWLDGVSHSDPEYFIHRDLKKQTEVLKRINKED